MIGGTDMNRKLVIDGNAVYEIDEECMLKKRIDENKNKTDRESEKNTSGENCSQP